MGGDATMRLLIWLFGEHTLLIMFPLNQHEMFIDDKSYQRISQLQSQISRLEVLELEHFN